jgi:general secretion pathway protein K
MTTKDTAERGSIAIVALWGVALVFMLIAPVAFATRGELRIATNAIADTRARLAAEAGTQLGIVRLLRRYDAGTAAFDGTPEDWRLGTTKVAIAISDEAGRIDLNAAPQELLEGLFVAAGVPREAAELTACNVLDRRGDTGTMCPETDAPHPARRFSVTEELAEVPGVGERLYDRVAESVTVATAASAIDPLVAPREVLLAIPGATATMVDDFLDSRATLHDLASAGVGVVPASAAQYLMTSPRRDFVIAATATTDGGARYRADLQIRLTGQSAHPYQVVGWRTPPANSGQDAPRLPHRAP